MSNTVVDDGSIRFFDDAGRLIGIHGLNKQGRVGVFIDEENGLCEHESVRIYCEDCTTQPSYQVRGDDL